jgi:hypothetical protein
MTVPSIKRWMSDLREGHFESREEKDRAVANQIEKAQGAGVRYVSFPDEYTLLGAAIV